MLIFDIDKNATVLAPPTKDGMVLVQAGIIKTRVKIDNLRLIKEKKQQPPQYSAKEMYTVLLMFARLRKWMFVAKPHLTQL